MTTDDRASTGGRFPFSPYFTGWYRVAASNAVSNRAPLTVRAFGQDLVVYRDEGGRGVALDAHCAHLGAHLGYGRVSGAELICPFHGWAYDIKGRCVAAPGARRTPRATVRSWPVLEIDGAFLVWFDKAQHPPTWKPSPALTTTEDSRWTRRRSGVRRVVKTHVQELAENGVDVAHFAKVHGFHIVSARSAEFEMAGPTLRHLIEQQFHVFGLSRFAPKLAKGSLEFRYDGVGIVTVLAKTPGVLDVEVITKLYFTPIDNETCSVVADYRMNRHGLLTPLLLSLSIQGAEAAIRDDTRIMERKAYRSLPILSDGDGPIMQFRSWAKQFHPSSSSPDDAL